jgi:hypothetical protein
LTLTVQQETQIADIYMSELQYRCKGCATAHPLRRKTALPRINEHEHCPSYVHDEKWCFSTKLDKGVQKWVRNYGLTFSPLTTGNRGFGISWFLEIWCYGVRLILSDCFSITPTSKRKSEKHVQRRWIHRGWTKTWWANLIEELCIV